MALGFVQKVCSTSLLELQSEESFIHLPYLPSCENFTFVESRWDLHFQCMHLRSKSCNISIQIHPFSDLRKSEISKSICIITTLLYLLVLSL